MSQRMAPDGGYFVPCREPVFEAAQIRSLGDFSSQEVLARILNLLFKTRLTAWDLEFSVGRNPVRIQKIGRRTLAGERWHNTAWTFDGMVSDIVRKIQTQQPENQTVGPWAEIGAGIASLFAIFAKAYREQLLTPGEKLDVAVPGEKLMAAISAWFARNWGLPIGTIVCGCSDGSELWNLIHNGEMRTHSVGNPDPALPAGLEMLLYLCGGRTEVVRYLRCAEFGNLYIPSDLAYGRLKEGMAVSVISRRRILSTIPSVKSSHNYLLAPDGAMAYAGLLDYRAVKGESGWGLVICDRSPGLDPELLSQALGIPEQEVRQYLSRN